MDKPTRNQIRKPTQDARALLETEFSQQLEALFDIHSDGTIAREGRGASEDRPADYSAKDRGRHRP
ncbi:hypothetical protein [Desulfosarcina sp.]|uniref:hypothetical protein n=1 Tax=Desulfosarcina sp. TaxID=2027861 RepID=UPI003970FC8C